MKKIGILNFWWISNYGALLTAYAIQSLTSEFNYTPILIDNSYKYNNSITKSFAKNFQKKYLKTSNKIISYNNFKNLNNLCNIFITGSDQIFRPSSAKERLYQYYQDFASIEAKKISFSASFAVDKKTLLEETDPKILEKIKISLNSFDFVSIREKSGIEICKDLFNIDAEWIIDPVFIINKSNYNKLIQNSTKDFSNTIVSYILDPNRNYNKVYKYLTKKYGIKVEKIAYSNESVENWLSAIKNCKLLITDSFHGMCFAIIFNKPFICVTNKKRGATRFESILEMLCIENQCINNINEIYKKDCIFKINYEKVNQRIEEERYKGINFLKKALETPIDKQEEKNKANIQFLKTQVYELEKEATLKFQIKKALWDFWLLIFHKYLPNPIKNIIRFMRSVKC